MKKALVLGAAGFIGGHLVTRLKRDGYWVRGADRKHPRFSKTDADEFLLCDLRWSKECQDTMTGGIDEVYQLAAEMGGMGYVGSHECEIMHNSVLINANAIRAAVKAEIKRYFFSSSVCVYRDMKEGEAVMSEDDVYPASPDNEYGWEKLYAERMIMAHSRKYGITARIARFENCYGPKGTWRGGREKAPAAICRKVAEAEDDGHVDVWGNGEAIRPYTYIDDTIDGIRLLLDSDVEGAVNIGTRESVSVNGLVATIIEESGKKVFIRRVSGPVGVESRNFSKDKIRSLGWKAQFSLKEGIALTYPWILDKVKEAKRED